MKSPSSDSFNPSPTQNSNYNKTIFKYRHTNSLLFHIQHPLLLGHWVFLNSIWSSNNIISEVAIKSLSEMTRLNKEIRQLALENRVMEQLLQKLATKFIQRGLLQSYWRMYAQLCHQMTLQKVWSRSWMWIRSWNHFLSFCQIACQW